MNFDIVGTPIGLLTLFCLLLIFIVSAKVLPLNSVSLPCMMVMTSLVYFFLMPVIELADGDPGFLGMYMTSLEWAHFAVFLYVLGASCAFLVHRRILFADPAAVRLDGRKINGAVFIALWAIAILGVVVQIWMGNLNLISAAEFDSDAVDLMSQNLLFLNESYNLLLPLTLIVLLRDNFRVRSLLIAFIVFFIFMQTGFRFRIMILLTAAVTAYAVDRGLKIRIWYTFAGVGIGIFLVNLLGAIRHYGRGVDVSDLDTSMQKATSFGAEFGIVYVFSYIADNPLPALVTFDPWIVGISRMVPTFIWPDKPAADYLKYLISGATAFNADKAGLGAPQQVEMLLQFGWLGLPILAFLYFSIIAYLLHRLGKLNRVARIAGCAIVPAFFGYYMQSRGYFFQILVDGLIIFGPLFLINWEERRPVADRGR
jgi:hypothetical protein